MDLKALIVKNDLKLPKEQVDRLLSQNGRHALHALSPDKESGAFLLFCCGDDLDLISAKLSIPKDVILATAIQYRWPDKASVLKSTTPIDLQKDLVNTILVATVMSVNRDLADVISGKKDASDCPLIPSSPQALEKLINMVNTVNSVSVPKQDQPQTVIHANNVQVNQQIGESPEPKKIEASKDEKAFLEKFNGKA